MATVYVAKLAFEEEMWNRPLSDFMPEFSAQVEQQGLSPDLNATRWNEITPLALASQISGLPTALTGLFGSTGDTFVTTFNASFDQWIASGMPSSFTEKQLNDPKITPECVLLGKSTVQETKPGSILNAQHLNVLVYVPRDNNQLFNVPFCV